MSEKVIDVQPYLVKDNLVDIDATIALDNVSDIFQEKKTSKINLYNVELSNGEILIPRKFSTVLTIKIKPVWAYGDAKRDISELISAGENPENAVMLRVRIVCSKTFWTTEQVIFKLSEIGKRDVEFKVFLKDVAEQIFIEAYLTRELKLANPEPRKAFLPYSIISQHEEFSIQIDEIESIGGNYLPIKAKDLKDVLFQIVADDAHTFPTIYYSNALEKLFRRNDLFSVNITFLMVMPAIMDQYLKWLVFRCQPDHTDKQQKALVEKIGNLTGYGKERLYEIMEGPWEQKAEKFLELSHKLFEGIQTLGGVNFKKELLKYINQERKLKHEPI